MRVGWVITGEGRRSGQAKRGTARRCREAWYLPFVGHRPKICLGVEGTAKKASVDNRYRVSACSLTLMELCPLLQSRTRHCMHQHCLASTCGIVAPAQTDAGKAELAQEMKRTRAAAVRSKIFMRGASPEKRRRASARDVFDSFDVDGSDTIDVRKMRNHGTWVRFAQCAFVVVARRQLHTSPLSCHLPSLGP